MVFAMPLFQGCMARDARDARPAAMEKPQFNEDYDAAVAYYSQALEENPDDLDIRFRLNEARQNASLQHMKKAKKFLENDFFREAIEELQLSVAFYPSNHRAVELIDQARNMQESYYYTRKGRAQVKAGNFSQARKSFQKALELNPDNAAAAASLEKFKQDPEDIFAFTPELQSSAPISMKFKKTPILNVFEILSRMTGVNFIFDKDLKESKVSLFMTDVRFDKFLEVLLQTNSLKAKMVNRNTLLIYPDTPAKAKEYDELYVKTFYLSYLKAPALLPILTKLLKSEDIIANEKINAVTIRGQKGVVQMAAKIIEANDRAPSEMVLNVEIMEVSKNKERELGLSVSDTITFGVSTTGSEISMDTDQGFAPLASLDALSQISSKELYLSLPTAVLKLLKRDGNTKTLAKPQLRVSSLEKASILIGERVPLRSNRKVQTDGSTTYDFQYQDVGIKLVTEPVINAYDQVTLKMGIEVSALGTNVGTVTDPQFSIRTRSADTVLTLFDGDTVIIGGLIEDRDRIDTQKVPMFGDMPVLGRLFSSNSSEASKTDILMSITPVIIRSQDIPESSVSGFWSGSSAQVSMEPPASESIKQDMAYKDMPDEDYVMVTADEAFLPSDRYFSIQAHSYPDEEKARKKAGQIAAMGYETWVRPAQIQGKGTYFRVFVGQYEGYTAARKMLEKLLKKDEFPEDMHVVDHDYVYGQ
jgi:general secretion pathway protein D